MPHTSPYTARAIGLTDMPEDYGDRAATVELRVSAGQVDDGRRLELEPEPEKEPEKDPHWQLYLPTKFDEGSSEVVKFSKFGWQSLVQRVAVQVGVEQRDIKGKEKHGSDRVICAIMQPYHLFREYYLARMNNKNCWVTKFFGLADMCEKVAMADWFNNLVPLLGADCKLLHITPKTFVIPKQRDQLRMFMHGTATGDGTERAEPRSVIVKPVGGSKGKGIFITQSFDDLEREVEHAAIAQEYIARPLLLDGLKFDLRVYVIVVGLGAQQQAFIAEEGLARFCTHVYTEPTGTICESDWARDALRAHLTNTAVNKGSDKYDVGMSKRTMSDVLQQLREIDSQGRLGFTFSGESFWHQLDNIVSSWLAIMNPVLRLTFRQASKAARSAALSRRKKNAGIRAFLAAQRAAAAVSEATVPDAMPKQPTGSGTDDKANGIAQKQHNAERVEVRGVCPEYDEYLSKCRSAQVLGFDVMLDASGKMHLLEVNNSPSLSTEEIRRVSEEVQATHIKGTTTTTQSTQLELDVCTDAGCEYSEANGSPHVHQEGTLDRHIKSPVVEALLRLIISRHESFSLSTSKDCLSVLPLRSNESTISVPPSLRLLEHAYATHFLDTDDVGPDGWPSSCLLSFSHPVGFCLPQSFRSALLALSATNEDESLDGMITGWEHDMKQKYVANERRSSSARFELGDIVGLLDRAIRQRKLRDGLDLPAVLSALATTTDE